ncbi:MAG: UTP--glucose-1-phosphate uridylyltransferase [Candidatus Saccharimonadales bacterium]
MDQKPKVTKAVIAAAGFGTRFLPQTKAMPKEMLPIVDKPVIQYIVEQLVEAGIEDIIIVSGYSKRAIEDHFDLPNEDLLNNLRAGGSKKAHYIEELERIADLANFAYVRQKGPYGTATPIMNAAHLIGNEPFIYTFADDITLATPNPYQQMIHCYEQYGGIVAACRRLTEVAEFDRYGIVGGQEVASNVIKADAMIEKPGKAKAPSDFGVTSGYLLTPEVLNYLEAGRQAVKPGAEFYVNDWVLQPMLDDGHAMYGLAIENSRRYDTGDKLEYVKTVIDFALQREDIGPALREHLRQKLS